MEAIFTTFGIEWKLLLVQGVNFGILLVGLTYFLYKPVSRMLEARRQTVTQGVLDAQKAAEARAEIEDSRASALAEAGKEADEIVSMARSAGTKKEREIVAQAEVSAAALLSEAEAQAKDDKARAVAESKEEVAKLIVLGMERVMQKQ